jgi:hypothetical protein
MIKRMTRNLLLIPVFLCFTACSIGKIVPVDPKTGLYPAQAQAKVITNKPIDLDQRKSLILVPNDDFIKGLITNIHYFDEVIDFKQLETRIIQANLTDKIPSVQDKIGINIAAKNYKDFIWFRYEKLTTDPSNPTARFILTDPITAEDIFITETELDYAWKGVNDQYNWYPMFNSVIEYIKANSKTYGKN